MTANLPPTGTNFDPKGRELCPDGACIGVIGRDGRCRECGTVLPGYEPPGEEATSDDAYGATPASMDAPPEAAAEGDAANEGTARAASPEDFDPDHRELCPDGACIGLIGADGRCKECGKSKS